MQATPLNLEPLLAPIPGPDPSGPDLMYHPDFQGLERVAAGKPERQYGDEVYPAEPPDWATLKELALPLAEQTRDLRLAMWLLRCATRSDGLLGAAQGLKLLNGLLERFWGSVHPQLDAFDNNDPTMRLNALLPLITPDAVLADLRLAAMAPERGSVTVRDIELALSRAEPGPNETLPTEAGVLQALEALSVRHPGMAGIATEAHLAAQAIAAQVERQVGVEQAPDFSALINLLHWPVLAMDKLVPASHGGNGVTPAEPANPAGEPTIAQAGTQAHEAPAPRAQWVNAEATGRPAPAGAAFQPSAVPSAQAAAAIASRQDAVRELDRVSQWIEQNEPGHPAPLLIRRASRLMGMSFLEIIRDMAPEGLAQVEHIAGSDPGS